MNVNYIYIFTPITLPGDQDNFHGTAQYISITSSGKKKKNYSWIDYTELGSPDESSTAAAFHGHEAEVRLLPVKEGLTNPKAGCLSERGLTPLSLAAWEGHREKW